MTNTSDKTIAGKIDTSDEACERACRNLLDWKIDTDSERTSTAALIRALCAERDEQRGELNFRELQVKDRSDIIHNQQLALVNALSRAEAAESELSSLRAKGCGVSEEVIAGDDETLLPCPCCGSLAQFIDCTETDNEGGRAIECTNAMCMLSSRVIFGEDTDRLLREAWNKRALLQSAPQDAKLPAPMEGEVAELVSLLRIHCPDCGGEPCLMCEAANALESLSRKSTAALNWQPIDHRPLTTGRYIVAHRGYAEIIYFLSPTDRIWQPRTKIGWQRDPSEFNADFCAMLPDTPDCAPPETAKEARR